MRTRPLFAPEHRPFLLRKLHSLTGTVPVGGFLVLHLWTNSKAMQGQAAYDAAISDIYQTPFLVWLELCFIYLPLLFHAGYGVKLSLQGSSNLGRYPFAKNWAYFMQRATGIVTLLFIALHLWQFRLPLFLGEIAKDDLFQELCASMSSTTAQGIPLMALMYLVGIAAASFHLSNGLYGFCFSWGITRSREAARRWSGVFGLAGLVVFAMGASTVVYFATGTTVWSSVSPELADSMTVSCNSLEPGKATPSHKPSAPAAASNAKGSVTP